MRLHTLDRSAAAEAPVRVARVDRPVRATLAVLLAVLLALVSACAAEEPGPPPPQALVVDIIDGDTVVVRSGRVTEPVRLIGIDTPEVAHHGQPGECFGGEAAARLAELIPVGTTVRLARDVEARDIYGRLLAYVFATDGTLVNMQLAREGLAAELSIAPNLALVDVIATSVGEARRARLGMWEHCGEAVASSS